MKSEGHFGRFVSLAVASGVFATALTGAFSASPAVAEQVQPDSSKLVALGRAIFHDKSLSNPPGMACVSCHAPETGYSYPVSFVNAMFGTVPGATKGRWGNRKPPSIAYAPYLATGTPRYDPKLFAFVGGLFYDGRAADAVEQVKSPMMNPNEMNNTVHGLGSAKMIAAKLEKSSTGALFRAVFGETAFRRPADGVVSLLSQAVAAYEKSDEVSPFTSKYDAFLEGKAELTLQETLGMRLVTGTLTGRPEGLPARGSAHCMDCHAASTDLSKSRDLWTNSCYANLGVPKNPANLFYVMSDRRSNPTGYNRDGLAYVDLGLGGSFYPSLGLAPGDFEHGDPLRINGTFKAPSLRNVDKRPYPGFVKSYMHNGVFKSLKEVVHFYNTRNLTTEPGEIIDFSRPNPYAGLKGKPLWPKPEYLDPWTLVNPTGTGGGLTNPTLTPEPMGDLDAQQIGNLNLTEPMEEAIVAFLKTLTDGYFKR